MAAACGAAAEVPKNGLNPGVRALVPSAAAMSGLTSRMPPLVPNRKFPGVIGVPSALKNMRRGPSELNPSVGLSAPPGNTRVVPRALFHATAATPKARPGQFGLVSAQPGGAL